MALRSVWFTVLVVDTVEFTRERLQNNTASLYIQQPRESF